MKKKIIAFLTLLISSFCVFAQNNTNLSTTRSLVLKGKINEAIVSYTKLLNDTPDNTNLMMEYAYALALGGVHESALMYLDRAVLLGANKEIYFYSAQVFTLMGYDNIASEFWQNNFPVKKPEWIPSDYSTWQQKYVQKTVINRGHDSIAFKRANFLAARGMHFQSIVLFQELIDQYPSEFLPRIGYSMVWEKIGMYEKAAKELETGIGLIKIQQGKNNDQTMNEALQAFENHLAELKLKSTNPATLLAIPQFAVNNKTLLMVYGGGMLSSSFISANVKFGVCLGKTLNMALDLGVSGNSDATHVNMGISVYERWGAWVTGVGFSAQMGETNSYGCQISSGFSFMNKKKNRSTDILINTIIPFNEGAKTIYGISFGQSFYFGKRK